VFLGMYRLGMPHTVLLLFQVELNLLDKGGKLLHRMSWMLYRLGMKRMKLDHRLM
jgi:hypothetical protein